MSELALMCADGVVTGGSIACQLPRPRAVCKRAICRLCDEGMNLVSARVSVWLRSRHERPLDVQF